MNLPLRLVLPTRWPAKPYGVTADNDQMLDRTRSLGIDNRIGHADNWEKRSRVLYVNPPNTNR